MIKRKRKLNKASIVNRPKVMHVKSDAVNRSHLTKGKLYKASPCVGFPGSLKDIVDDTGGVISILVNGCAFLDGGSWDVVWL